MLRELDAQYWKAIDLKDRLAEAMAQLKVLDPIGWEAWFDDDKNVPPYFRGWANAGPVVEAIEKRVAELQHAPIVAQVSAGVTTS